MQKLSRTLLFLAAGLGISIFVCIAIWLLGLFFVGIPLAGDAIGEPAPDIDPLQETIISIFLAGNLGALRTPVGDAAQDMEFVVEEGESARDVVGKLKEHGFIQNDLLFLLYLRYRGLDRGIEAGIYNLPGGLTIPELAEVLQSARSSSSAVTIPEGWRREQIGESLSLFINLSPDEFIALTSQPIPGFSFSSEIPPNATLEGFLFPDTYQITPDDITLDLVLLMMANFDNQVTPNVRLAFANQGLSLFQAGTLASIVEREAVVPDERPIIASVFLNRLSAGMNLDADPTVQYALGKPQDDNWWKAPLFFEDLEIDSPYNTYRYLGLPPGPIANPGLDSLLAVAHPDTTPYLYFRATCDGSGEHLFAETFEGHLQNACE